MAEVSREAGWAKLRELCDTIMAKRRLILVSNRGPVDIKSALRAVSRGDGEAAVW